MKRWNGVRDEMFHQLPAVGEGLAAEEQLERAFEKAPCRRPLKPHDVTVNNRERREQRADEIRHQRCVKVLQVPGSYEDSDNKQQGGQRGDRERPQVQRAEHGAHRIHIRPPCP
jgi:hypothetical protein